MADAIHPDESTTTAPQTEASPPKKKHGRRILALLKGTTKGGVETMLGTDRLKAAAGAQHAKNRLGVLKSGPMRPSGPVEFQARYQGKKGHLYITTTATSPALSWTTEQEDIDPIFSIAIGDIRVSSSTDRFSLKSAKRLSGDQKDWWSGLESQDGCRMGHRQRNSRRNSYYQQ